MNKRTNECFIVNQDAHNKQYNHSIQLIHIKKISLDRTIQKNTKNKITFSKKYSHNGCLLDLPSTETHSIHNSIKF